MTTTTITTTAEALVVAGCEAATERLRWEYNRAYRRRLRLPGVHPNNRDADRDACIHIRHELPIVLARHLPGIQLVCWDDPTPNIIDSLWHHPTGWDIDIHWDYHPDWTIGDPTAITLHPTQTNDHKAVA